MEREQRAKTKTAGSSLTIDGKQYSLNGASAEALARVADIRFCNEMISQLENEWAVADTARIGYLNALKAETNR